MKFTYDTEFLEDGETIELISIGVVAEDGREYYAVNAEAPMDRIRKHMWLMTNVVPHLPLRGRHSLNMWLAHSRNSYPQPSISDVDLDRTNALVKPKWVIANEVRDFLDTDEVELWAYYSAYDHVALMQLFGPMISRPPHIPMWTNDYKQVMHERRLSSEDLPPQLDGEHNALADARQNVRRLKALGIWS